MRRRRLPASAPQRDDLEAALATMSAEDLREVVREMLLELDDKSHGRVMSSLINRAARSGTGWAPAALSDDEVEDAISFAKAAKRVGQADPSEVDEHLRKGSAAFLGKDYAAAHRIFGALLPPVGDGDIFLGQDEMIDEVLGTDTDACAAQYVVSVYMLTPPAQRAEAVRQAISEVRSVGHFWEPLGELERAAVEPLPGFHDFLAQWRALIVPKPSNQRDRDWDTQEDRWLREVVQRLEGSDGLAKVARSTRRADDLRAWCKSLVDARQWKSALAAFEEAAELVADKERARGEFLDGAALAAQTLGRKDLPARLEKAWRAGPTVLRLRRWLGSSSSKAILGKRVAQALEGCPTQAARQRALLHVFESDFVPAATLLAAAPGLGWSNQEHPGHLLFPLFARLLGGMRGLPSAATDQLSLRDMDEVFESTTTDPDAPRLIAPEIEALLEQAGVEAISDSAAWATILTAMKKAAENRTAGVTEQKRRQYYGHAAELVALCVACDTAGETARWAAALKANYNRFPALRSELDRAMRAL